MVCHSPRLGHSVQTCIDVLLSVYVFGQVNTLGPLRVTKALLPSLKKGSKVWTCLPPHTSMLAPS